MILLKRWLMVTALLCGGGQIAGAATVDGAEERTFAVRGIVESPWDGGTISIRHEEIPGFMPAMTMPFYADEADAGKFAPGDVVEFTFVVGERSRATDFRRVGRAAAARESRSSPAATPATARRRLREGDAVPPFALIDQDGQAVTETDLRGHRTIVTFIFTRCPVPEFCPLIAKRFQALQQELTTRGDTTKLLSVSIDPEHDRPAVLKDYGRSLGADFERWKFATGATEQVEALTKLFAVRTERNGGALDHTLATALIGPDGKVVEIWRGNGWKLDEVLEKVASTTQGS